MFATIARKCYKAKLLYFICDSQTETQTTNFLHIVQYHIGKGFEKTRKIISNQRYKQHQEPKG